MKKVYGKYQYKDSKEPYLPSSGKNYSSGKDQVPPKRVPEGKSYEMITSCIHNEGKTGSKAGS